MQTGWIKIHRKIEEWPLYFSEPFTKAHAWIDLLIIAQFHPSKINIRGNIVDVKMGEIAWSEDALARRWLWSRSKVRRFLNWLKMAQQIEIEKSNIISKIIILNYKQYQQNDTTDDTTERRQTIQQTNTYKERKKGKKGKNITESATAIAVADSKEIVSVFDAFRESFPMQQYGNKTHRAAIEYMLGCYGPEKTIAAAQYAISIQDQKFAPIITNPYQLKMKMGELIVFKARKDNELNAMPKGVRI